MPRIGAGRVDGAPAWQKQPQHGGGGSGGLLLSGSSPSALFSSYLSAAGGELPGAGDVLDDPVFVRGLERVQEYLASGGSPDDGGGACLICLGPIQQREAVWSCQGGCFAVMHLTCTQDWARSQLDAAAARAAGAGQQQQQPAEWGCPKCRQSYPPSALPSAYRCFCGKQTDPEWDPWITAHSCGETCGKPLAGGCGHTCLLLCHPGPCPPCPRTLDASCHCGRAMHRKRCGHHEWGCGGVCGRRLECGHTCPEECHPGDCAPCTKVSSFACQCGREHRSLPCHQRVFQCARVCGQPLDCGRHTCERVCHTGPCGPCADAGARVCPCGKASHPELTCADKAPTCSQTCGKLLGCGMHRCMDRCHFGACTQTCKELVVKSCRCGKLQKEVLCHTELTCERRCNGLRACQRHLCKRRCCDGSCPPCEETCGRKLRCGNHKCPAPCHSGPCRPCPLTLDVTCACGAARATLPCGAEKWAAAPRCTRPCVIPALCRHAASPASSSVAPSELGSAGPAPPSPHLHPCHYGPCPPCPLPCGTRQPCGHTCASDRCHDPPPPPVPEFAKPAPPSMMQQQQNGVSRGADIPSAASPAPALAAARLACEALRCGPALGACPPCSVRVPVTCLGGHTQVEVECHRAGAFSCGAPCGRPLPCGNHACSRPCHAVTPSPQPPLNGAAAASNGLSAGASGCEACSRPCPRPRPRGCPHACPLPCHPGPCPTCSQPVSTPCHCGKCSLQLPCHVALATSESVPGSGSGPGPGSADPRSCGKPCHRPLPGCTHFCREPCHPRACPAAKECREEVTVRCNCKRLKAKWPCHQVQAALAASGRGGWYDAGVAARVLPCGDGCDKPAAAAAGGSKDKAAAVQGEKNGELAEGRAGASAAVTAQQQQAAAPAAPKQRLSKAEREALARQEAEQKEAERKREAWLRFARGLAAWLLIVAIGLALATWGEGVLKWMDRAAQDRWRPEGGVPR